MSLLVDVEIERGPAGVRAAFSAHEGATVALVGPNGAGKSTIVQAIAGLVPVARGRVELDDIALLDTERAVDRPPHERPVGMLFQDLLLLPHLSATENVAFPLRARGVPRPRARARAGELLDRLGVGHRRDAAPRRLSGGEAQRVALARALVHEPRLLLLDEPTSSLDVSSRGTIRALVAQILGGFPGVRLVVTHDPVEAATLADLLVVIEGGRVTQIGTPSEIRAAPGTPYAAELVGVNLFRGRLEPLDRGAGRLATDDGDIVVAWPGERPAVAVDGAIGVLRPADVSLHGREPEGSARNVVRCTVLAVSMEGERARVRLQGAPPLVAEITIGSVERLGVAPGAEIWASFKAVEIQLSLPGAGL